MARPSSLIDSQTQEVLLADCISRDLKRALDQYNLDMSENFNAIGRYVVLSQCTAFFIIIEFSLLHQLFQRIMELHYDKTVVALLMLSQYFGHNHKECVSYYECILKKICSDV